MKTTLIIFFIIINLASVAFSQSELPAVVPVGIIQLQSGEKVTGKVEMHRPFLGTPYLTLNDSIKYTLDKVRAFENSEGYFGKVAGSKTTMVRRTSQGKIDLYQESKSSWSPGHSYSYGTPMGTQTVSTPGSFGSYSVDYFSKNGGDILEADYSNLKIALADNAESMKHLTTYRTLSYVQWGLAGGGVALIAGGLATSSKEELNKGLIVTGAVVALLAWIPHLMQGGELESAIKVYNDN